MSEKMYLVWVLDHANRPRAQIQYGLHRKENKPVAVAARHVVRDEHLALPLDDLARLYPPPRRAA